MKTPANYNKEAISVAVKEKIRIRIKGYDHQLVDQASEKIVGFNFSSRVFFCNLCCNRIR